MNKMISALLASGIAFLTLQANARLQTGPGTQEKDGSIRCEDVGEDDGSGVEVFAKIRIGLDAVGEASSILVERKKTDGQKAQRLVLNKSNAVFKHSIEPNRVEDIDEDTKQPIYAYGIKQVEVIEVTYGENKIKLFLHDHSYS